jgi:two-component system sensor histidine kinase RegB
MTTRRSHLGPRATLPWLVRLRWVAVTSQFATVGLVGAVLGVRLPYLPVLATIGLTAATNLFIGRWSAGDSRRLVAGVLVLDTVLLTLLLGLTGGPANPFGVLYLVHVALAAVALGARWGAAVTALSAAGHAVLPRWHLPLVPEARAWPFEALRTVGPWLGLVTVAVSIAYFVSHVSAALQRSERDLSEAEAKAARSEKLASLTTLAAGAAHELGTPLGTIAVVARELERSAAGRGLDEAFSEDLRLIREQVERCRLILVQMSARAGEASGEAPARVETAVLVRDVKAVLGSDRAARLVVESPVGASVHAPRGALVHVLSSLVRNAFDASPATAVVSLEVASHEDGVEFTVRDRGHGMPPDVLSRAGEPFFTTKLEGQGTGLGLFLARTFADRLGGRLDLASVEGEGTTLRLRLPQPVVLERVA